MAIIPNLITFSRVLCAPIFCFLLSSERRILAIFVLLWGAISDFLDGYLARNSKNLGGISKFGEVFDPVADKIFSNAVLWSLYFYTQGEKTLILIITIILLLRDLILIFGASYILFNKKLHNISISPLLISKICTGTLFALCFLILVTGHANSSITIVLSYSSLGMILITSFLYVRRFLKG